MEELSLPAKLWLLASGAAFIALALAVASLLLPPRETEDVPLPSDSATPEEVVATYLRAVDAHDCATAQALTTSDARDIATGWCREVADLADIEVGDALPDSRRRGTTDVEVSFDLDWRLFHDDGSLPEGPTTWGYILVRRTPDGPWRITDQGTG